MFWCGPSSCSCCRVGGGEGTISQPEVDAAPTAKETSTEVGGVTVFTNDDTPNEDSVVKGPSRRNHRKHEVKDSKESSSVKTNNEAEAAKSGCNSTDSKQSTGQKSPAEPSDSKDDTAKTAPRLKSRKSQGASPVELEKSLSGPLLFNDEDSEEEDQGSGGRQRRTKKPLTASVAADGSTGVSRTARARGRQPTANLASLEPETSLASAGPTRAKSDGRKKLPRQRSVVEERDELLELLAAEVEADAGGNTAGPSAGSSITKSPSSGARTWQQAKAEQLKRRATEDRHGDTSDTQGVHSAPQVGASQHKHDRERERR